MLVMHTNGSRAHRWKDFNPPLPSHQCLTLTAAATAVTSATGMTCSATICTPASRRPPVAAVSKSVSDDVVSARVIAASIVIGSICNARARSGAAGTANAVAWAVAIPGAGALRITRPGACRHEQCRQNNSGKRQFSCRFHIIGKLIVFSGMRDAIIEPKCEICFHAPVPFCVQERVRCKERGWCNHPPGCHCPHRPSRRFHRGSLRHGHLFSLP